MINTIAIIAAGGALGALARHGVNVLSLKLLGDGFPWGTLAVNVLGCFLVGVLIMLFDHVWEPSETVRRFLITGGIGAFTTFSAFSLDAFNLWERGALVPMTGYVMGSVVLSLGALFLGLLLVRSLVS